MVEALLQVNSASTSIEKAVDSLPGSFESNRIKGLLNSLFMQTDEDPESFRKSIETHFNAAMDRASGWFKRYSQILAIAVSAVVVLLANVDTITLVSSLASNPAARMKMVEIAEQRLKEAKDTEAQARQVKPVEAQIAHAWPPEVKLIRTDGAVEQATKQTTIALHDYEQAVSNMRSAGFEIGWKRWPTWEELGAKAIGLIISITLISLGAPFWLDLLQRFMQVRAAGGLPPEMKKKQ